MNAQLKPRSPSPIVLPGTVAILRQVVEPSVRKFFLQEAEPHTDKALLEYCGYNEYLGGHVERRVNETIVFRYTS